MVGTELAIKEKNSFFLNKSTTQCSRPIAIKLHFLFCFVLHILFPNHMVALLSKSWVNSLMRSYTLSKRIYQSPCPWQATCHSPMVHTKLQPEARYIQPPLRRKQTREWVPLVSYLQFKQDLKCCRTFQTSECSPS